MVVKFETSLIEYIRSRLGTFKKYLIAAVNSKDCCLSYIEYCEGTIVIGTDIKNCQLLRDAKLFTENTKLSRNGRITYKIFCLTDKGKKIAQKLKEEEKNTVDNRLLNEETVFVTA